MLPFKFITIFEYFAVRAPEYSSRTGQKMAIVRNSAQKNRAENRSARIFVRDRIVRIDDGFVFGSAFENSAFSPT